MLGVHVRDQGYVNCSFNFLSQLYEGVDETSNINTKSRKTVRMAKAISSMEGERNLTVYC